VAVVAHAMLISIIMCRWSALQLTGLEDKQLQLQAGLTLTGWIGAGWKTLK